MPTIKRAPVKFQPSWAAKAVPIVLSSGDFALTAGQSFTPDMVRLSHPFRTAYLIDEVRFRIWYLTAGAPNTSANLGGDVLCKLMMGRVALTGGGPGGFVPIWNFGPPLTLVGVEGLIDGGWLTTPFLGARVAFNQFRWRLPVPLFVPPGNSLNPTFQGSAKMNNGNQVNVDVTFAGRALPPGTPMPDAIDVPYATAWVGALSNTTAGTVQQSGQQDLWNPFLVPLTMQRFIGRIRASTSNGVQKVGDMLSDSNAGVLSIPSSYRGISCKLSDSFGQNVIRDFTQFGSLFEINRRGWTAPRVVQPRENFLAFFSVNTSLATQTYQPMISMIGYREEAFSS